MSKIAVVGIIGNSVFLPVARFHEGGETVEASSVHFEVGGKGFNQAIAARRCGAEVSFLAAVGREGVREFSSFLDGEGIRHKLVLKDEPSAFAAIVTDSVGNNRVTVYQGAELSPEDVDPFESEIREADILLINNEVPEAVNAAAVRLAVKHGTRCILNPAPARNTDSFILENVYLFTPNEHETLGIENRENVIVTLGKRGCLVKAEDEVVPACNFGVAVDTTGAGDTFNGVLAAMLSGGMSLLESAGIANCVAALGVTRKYALSSIPTHAEIMRIIEENQNARGK